MLTRDLSTLQSNEFDVVIIGGGITGSFLALDAATRGFSVSLVEKGDFGAATSSASSKLLHSGIRYLQQGLPHKVRESALERVRFQNLAPHLCCYVPFIVPAYQSLRKGRALLKTAALVYETLCLGQNRHLRDPARGVPKCRSMSKCEIQRLLPAPPSDPITGGMLIYESHMHSSERMTLAVLDSAERHGAALANYIRVTSLTGDRSRVVGVRAVDLCGGRELEIRAKIVVNASGPWIPRVNEALPIASLTRLINTYFKGAHIVTRPLTATHAVALPTHRGNQGIIDRGGRHVFVIPWRGHSLIGTTYGPFDGDLDDVHASEEDISELMEDVNAAFATPVLRRADVAHAFAGIYPLLHDAINPSVYQGASRYEITDHARTDGVQGLVSVFGAKFTTARSLAQRAVDLIARKLKREPGECRTKNMVLASADVGDVDSYRRARQIEHRAVLSDSIIDHLVRNYGALTEGVLDFVRTDPTLGRRVAPQQEIIAAEITHAVENEMARHLDDFVFRRTGLGTLGNPGKAVLEDCAVVMGETLCWSRSMREAEVDRTMSRFVP